MNPRPYRPWPLHHPLAPHPSPLSLSSAQGNLVENPFVSQRFFRRKISARCFGDLPALAARAARPTPKLHGTAQPSWSDDLKKITKQKMYKNYTLTPTLTSAWHSDANKKYMQSVHRWSFWNMKEPRNVRSGEIGPESFGASQIPPEEHGSVLVPKLNKKTSNEDAPGRSTHLHEGPHLLTSSSPKNKGCREKPPLRLATPRYQLLKNPGMIFEDLWLWCGSKLGPKMERLL